MRRADRLLQILILLRGKALISAQELAARLEVSVRTIYRDMRDLQMSGAPINGEPGHGYHLEKGFTPPALYFSLDELQALEVGVRLLSAWVDDNTADAAERALQKIHSVLGSSELIAPKLFAVPQDYPRLYMGKISVAIQEKYCLHLTYQDETGETSQRTIAPLGLFFWGSKWTFAAWCFLRHSYRHFRVDRCIHAEKDNTPFPTDISLDHFLATSGVCVEDRMAVQTQTQQAWHKN